MRPLRLVSINIERSNHIARVLPFLKASDADVICIQELCERDIPEFESLLGMRAVYAPVGLHPADPPEEGAVMTGIAFFSREAPLSIREIYYKGDRTQAETAPAHRTATDAPLLCADIDCDGTTYRVLSTHFTWTPDGSASDEQRVDMRKLLNTLSAEGEFVLCGDFNAPRGGEIFAELASRYTDNIPPQYATSIDVTLHKRGRERPHELSDKMVDGLFTTPGYRARDVELHFGISDHAAVTALIERV